MTAFVDEPLASQSGVFALNGTTDSIDDTEPAASPEVVPWSVRRAVPTRPGTQLPATKFDDDLQVAVDPDGFPLHMAKRGPPTADTTAPTDGEDPPSAEDWNND